MSISYMSIFHVTLLEYSRAFFIIIIIINIL